MSIDHTVCFGIGWIIPKEEYEEMRENAGDKWGEIEDNFRHIDCYRENSDVFLGETFGWIGEGDYLDINHVVDKMLKEFDGEFFSDDYADILSLCGRDISPGSVWAEAKIYILSLLH